MNDLGSNVKLYSSASFGFSNGKLSMDNDDKDKEKEKAGDKDKDGASSAQSSSRDGRDGGIMAGGFLDV